MELIFVCLFHLKNKWGSLVRPEFLLKICLPFVILICDSHMWLRVNRELCMTLAYCTMQWKWMHKSSHILHKVQTLQTFCMLNLHLKFLYHFFICAGKYYVVDTGYPNRPGCLAPYKGERYHLPEWHQGMEPHTPKHKFNGIHSSIHNVIKR